MFVISSSDSEPQREEILFEKVDKNLDGYLTKAELDSVFLLFDINREYLPFELLNYIDTSCAFSFIL